jgi:hypothetical protein
VISSVKKPKRGVGEFLQSVPWADSFGKAFIAGVAGVHRSYLVLKITS